MMGKLSWVIVAVAVSSACAGSDELVPIDAAVAIDAPDAAEVDAPDIDAPDIDAPDIDAPDIDAPNIDAPIDGPVPVDEPYNSLLWIQLRAEAYFQAHGTFPLASATFTPAAPCCTRPGMQCPSVLAEWDVAPWLDLGFVMTVPFRYQYTYNATGGSSLVAIARGDLDCDGVASDFRLICTSSGSATSCTINVPANHRLR